MFLAVDIGNSLIKFGVFDGENLIARFSVATKRDLSAPEFYEQTKNDLVDFSGDFSGVAVSSVVPELAEAFRVFSEKYLKCTPVFVDNSFDFGLEIDYFPPENLGSDRLINAFAAARKYGKPCIVCSFGTATTIDFVSRANRYRGGIIAPGMKTLAEALHLKTSKLPLVELEKPASVIGNSTVKSIQSGVFYGYIGLVEGILNRFFAESNEKPFVVATGGFASRVAENCALIDIVDENLMLEGLKLVVNGE